MGNYKITTGQFFIPFIIGIVAGYIHHNYPDRVGMWLTGYIASGFCIAWMFFYTWMRERANLHLEEGYKLEQYRRLSADEKVELGYKVAASNVKIEHVYKERGEFRQQKNIILPWSPGRTQTFFTAILRGAKPTFREWEGSGRLFADGDFEKGMTLMIDSLGYFKRRGEAANSPREITDEGILGMMAYMDEVGVPYEVLPEYLERVQGKR